MLLGLLRWADRFEYTLTVTDIVTNKSKPYLKPGFKYDGGADSSTFP